MTRVLKETALAFNAELTKSRLRLNFKLYRRTMKHAGAKVPQLSCHQQMGSKVCWLLFGRRGLLDNLCEETPPYVFA